MQTSISATSVLHDGGRAAIDDDVGEDWNMDDGGSVLLLNSGVSASVGSPQLMDVPGTRL